MTDVQEDKKHDDNEIDVTREIDKLSNRNTSIIAIISGITGIIGFVCYIIFMINAGFTTTGFMFMFLTYLLAAISLITGIIGLIQIILKNDKGLPWLIPGFLYFIIILCFTFIIISK
jgi:hypothetical protein